MTKISEQLVNKGLSESTANQYMRNLFKLNDSEEFNNLTFLKDYETINERLKKYRTSSQRTMVATIVSVLSTHPRGMTKPLKHWRNLLEEMIKEHQENSNPNEKSEKQEQNWMTWEEIEQIRKDLRKYLDENLKNKRDLTTKKYNKLLDYFLVSLYTLIPPRRNMDYMKMLVVKKVPEDGKENYLDVKNMKMHFNKYKTVKKYGTQTVDLKEFPEFLDALSLYLKYHPGKSDDEGNVYLLQDYDGERFKYVNSITRVLNRIFGKKVGSSMLRHIYLSHKYGDNLEERKKDAEHMGHSVSMAQDYIKTS